MLSGKAPKCWTRLPHLLECPKKRSARMSSTSPDHPRGSRYDDAFRLSVTDPEQFWGKVSSNTVWTKPWTKVLDNSNPPFTKWFVDGRLSLCYNAVDRHVEEGKGGKRALLWDSPIAGCKKSFTYDDLKRETSSLGGVLSHLGVGRGDRVLIYMPMIPETIVAMLACTRIGAVHSVVFGGFSGKELATRIRHCKPKVILTASCGIEPSRILNYKWIVEDAVLHANAPDVPKIVYQRPQFPSAPMTSGMDFDWDNEMSKGRKTDCVDVDANDPLYILYTSGTTGDPKGVQHPTGGHAVVNKWTMENLYGIRPGETWWSSSDLGWIVGHEYICYSPLLNCNTTVLYEGKLVGAPNVGQYAREEKTFPKEGHLPVRPIDKGTAAVNRPSEVKRVIKEYDVNGFFTAPTALRGIKKEETNSGDGHSNDMPSLRNVFVAGELCDEELRNWAQNYFKVPVLNHWWQTETGHAITATCVGLGNESKQPRDVVGFPVPGFNIKVLKEDGTDAAVGELGRIVCKLPLPPGTMTTLYNADDRFKQSYFNKFKGYYDTMDAGYLDEHGYVSVAGREDDVINVAGHRLSTSALEEAVLEHPDVEDCAVIGIPDDMKGAVPLALYVKKEGSTKSESLIGEELVALIRKNIGPVAAFRLSVRVTGLPRTRSGKTSRKSMADMAMGKKIKIPPTIEDASVYQNIKEALASLNLGIEIQTPEL